MTERRRPLENDDGQESLFGGDAFAARPSRPPERWDARVRDHAELSAPLDEPLAGFEADLADDAAPPAAFEAGIADAAPAPLEPGVADDAPAPFELDESPENAAASRRDDDNDFGPSLADYEAYAEQLAAEHDVRTPAKQVPVEDAGDELAALEAATEDVRRPRAPLAGPTLDDVMSRVWEGLVTGLPAACPVCHGEVVPASQGPARGRCTSCKTTID